MKALKWTLDSMTEIIGMEFEIVTYQIDRLEVEKKRNPFNPSEPKVTGRLIDIQSKIESLKNQKREIEEMMDAVDVIKLKAQMLSSMRVSKSVKNDGSGVSSTEP